MGMHTYLILRGISTLEAGDDGPRPYDFGAANNFFLVMGRDPRLWFWPVLTTDVRVATAGGTLFRGYIGDAAFAARLRLHEELVARARRGSGLGVAVAEEDESGDEVVSPRAGASAAAGSEEAVRLLP